MDFNQSAQMKALDMAQKAGMAGLAIPSNRIGITDPIAVESVGNIVQLLLSQSQELRERTSNIACQIAGAIPEPANDKVRQQPDSLIGILRIVSEALQSALGEAERAQRAL